MELVKHLQKVNVGVASWVAKQLKNLGSLEINQFQENLWKSWI